MLKQLFFISLFLLVGCTSEEWVVPPECSCGLYAQDNWGACVQPDRIERFGDTFCKQRGLKHYTGKLICIDYRELGVAFVCQSDDGMIDFKNQMMIFSGGFCDADEIVNITYQKVESEFESNKTMLKIANATCIKTERILYDNY